MTKLTITDVRRSEDNFVYITFDERNKFGVPTGAIRTALFLSNFVLPQVGDEFVQIIEPLTFSGLSLGGGRLVIWEHDASRRFFMGGRDFRTEDAEPELSLVDITASDL